MSGLLPNTMLYFSSQDEYDRTVSEFAQKFADIADEYVMNKVLIKTLELSYVSSIRRKDGRLVFFIESPVDFRNGFCPFDDSEVKINGKTYTVIGVEQPCIENIKKGTVIGLWVKK